MIIRCDHCRKETVAFSGGGRLLICQVCGCEVRDSLTDQESLVTQSRYESQLNFDNGLADYPGQLANAPSIPGDVAEVPLATAKYLPTEFFEEEAQLADEVANLDERWAEQNLLDKIAHLEKTYQLAEAAAAQELETPQVRFDNEHVATPLADRTGANPSNIPSAPKASPTSSINPEAWGQIPAAPGPGDREASRGSLAGTNSTVVAPRGVSLRVDNSHSKALPIAKPLSGAPEPSKQPSAGPVVGGGSQQPSRLESNELVWDKSTIAEPVDGRLVASLGLATTWCVQLLIGLVLLSGGPLAIWSLWLVTETAGTIFLGRVLWFLLLQTKEVDSEPSSSMAGPMGQVLINRRRSQTSSAR